MWTRAQLKYQANGVLKRGYLACLGVSTFLYFFAGASPFARLFPKTRVGDGHQSGIHINIGPAHFTANSFWANLGATVLLLLTLALIIGGFFYLVFVAGPLHVGKARFYIGMRNNQNASFSQIFSPFANVGYQNIVRTMGKAYLQVFLWMLLIIPGIMKAYSYRLVPYILAENPHIDPQRALEISEQTMYGERWNAFILDLSFFGWLFLGALCLGIGQLLVMPYIDATDLELYGVLRQKAISTGICSPQELSTLHY